MSDRRLGYAFFVLIAAAVAAYQYYAFSSLHATFADFRAFWCAGSVLASHGNPYHSQPLLGCERGALPAMFYRPPAGAALPAPLPGYALALFVPLALLPLTSAALLWLVLTCVAAAACAALLAAIARMPLAVCAWAFLLPALALWLPYGEIAPVAIAGALLTAWALQRERFDIAAAGLAVAAFQPQLALGVWISCLVLVPRIRVPLLIAGSALCALWAATGPALGAEYLRTVLPLHALAELPRLSQYSVSWILHALGASTGTALRAGTASYVIALGLSIPAARALARKWNDAALVVLVPFAAAALGGAFVHAAELAATIPLALALAAQSRGIVKGCSVASAVVLTLPWYAFRFEFALVPVAIVVSGVLAALLARSTIWGVRAAFAVALTLCGVLLAFRYDVTLRVSAPVPQALKEHRVYASASWGGYIWATESGLTVSALLAKSPVWLALLLLVCGASGALTDKELVPAVRIKNAPTVL